VLIEGEAGIGKTRLLDAALEDARRRGMQVAAGRAEELEGMRPFGLMTGVFGCTRSATDPRRAAIGELLSGGTGERNPITVTSDPGVASAPVAGQPRRGQEAREPGAGSRKMRLRARSRTGTGSPLSTASRRESLPHR
jgi:hypothetical protein